MGEIADDIIEGMRCGWCGCFVNEDPPGFSVLCDDCSEEYIKEDDDEDT
jgi:hypothetical protein